MAEWTDSGGDTDNVPDGTIVMWNGDPSNVPDSWTLCDGTNPDGPDSDVPDLRNRFIVGAGDEYGEGDTGGEKKVQLTEAELPSHSHSRGHSGGGWGGSGVDGRGSNTVETGSTGDDQPHENRPPYYALAYIMKIGGIISHIQGLEAPKKLFSPSLATSKTSEAQT